MSSKRSSVSLGLSLIARDEERDLLRLLTSIEGAFDQVALLDTGSTDRTVSIFHDWAEKESLPLGYVVDEYEWCDDFAAAKNAADSLLETDWICSADADEAIQGATLLRSIVQGVPANIQLLAAEWRPFPGSDFGFPLNLLSCRGAATWVGRVDATKRLRAGAGDAHGMIDPARVTWVHYRHPHRASSNDRNIRIWRKWIREEPSDPTPYKEWAIHELTMNDDPGAAARLLRQYLARVEGRVPYMALRAVDDLERCSDGVPDDTKQLVSLLIRTPSARVDVPLYLLQLILSQTEPLDCESVPVFPERGGGESATATPPLLTALTRG